MLNLKIWIIIGIIATLILGILLGIIIDHNIYIKHLNEHKNWVTKQILQEQFLAHLSRKLNLTMPQIQTIGGILRIQALKATSAQEDFQNKLISIKTETIQKIKPYLSPEQQEKFTKLSESYKRRWIKLCGTD